jgi:hypothetical protein
MTDPSTFYFLSTVLDPSTVLMQNKVELLYRHGRQGDVSSTTDDSEDANWIAKRHSIGLFNVRHLISVSEDARHCQRRHNAYQGL